MIPLEDGDDEEMKKLEGKLCWCYSMNPTRKKNYDNEVKTT